MLSACSSGDADPSAAGVVGETRALEEAAEMLDERRLPAQATAAPASSAEVEIAPTAQR